jgi:hypothetical protein
VVWQGSAGNRRPYADQTPFQESPIRLTLIPKHRAEAMCAASCAPITRSPIRKFAVVVAISTLQALKPVSVAPHFSLQSMYRRKARKPLASI